MTLRPDLIVGLQRLVVEGATFSGLLRYLLRQHPLGELSQSEVRAYLMQAFGIDFHERVRMDVDDPRNEAAYALVDTHLLPEIAGARRAWVSETSGNGFGTEWMDSFPVQPPGEKESATSAPGTPVGGLSEATWAALSEAERARLRQLEASNRTYWMHLLLLARLCERLQRRIDAPEVPASRSDGDPA